MKVIIEFDADDYAYEHDYVDTIYTHSGHINIYRESDGTVRTDACERYFTDGIDVWSYSEIEELATVENCLKYIQIYDLEEDLGYVLGKKFAFQLFNTLYGSGEEKAKQMIEKALKNFVMEECEAFLEGCIKNEIC